MGGTVSVTVRKDGREYRMQRWTNTLPNFVVNDRLIEGSEEHLQQYLEQWLLMREDYELNKDTGQFVHNMTSAYFPNYGLCPVSYGLAVIDYDTKTILSMQGYCGFDMLYSSGIYLDRNDSSEYSRYVVFKRLFEKGYIKRATNYKKDIDLSDMSFEKIQSKYISDPYSSADFFVDCDWNVIYFEEDAQGARDFKAKVEELGFVLLDEEEKEWEEFIREYEEEY